MAMEQQQQQRATSSRTVFGKHNHHRRHNLTNNNNQETTNVKKAFGPSRPPLNDKEYSVDSDFAMGMASVAMMNDMAAAMMNHPMIHGGSGGYNDDDDDDDDNVDQEDDDANDAVAIVDTMNVEELDHHLDSMKEKAAAAAAGQKTFGHHHAKHGLPCTEAEMKALMSMFVEIMGMSNNNDNNNSGANGNGGDSKLPATTTGSNAGGPVFTFETTPKDDLSSTFAAAAAAVVSGHCLTGTTTGFFSDGTTTTTTTTTTTPTASSPSSWEAFRRTYAMAEQMALLDRDGKQDDRHYHDNGDNDDGHDHDHANIDNRELTVEEMEFLIHCRKQREDAAAKMGSQFACGNWESIEQVPINDHLLQVEDNEWRAAKKREKKQRRKEKLIEEAAQKASDAAQKKREKAIVSWRTRVVSACQANEVTKLESLLQESPLDKVQKVGDNQAENLSASVITSHLEFLLPNSVAKNRAHADRGVEARSRLAEFILDMKLLLAFKPLRTGRTAFHTACFYGDVRFVELLFEKMKSYTPDENSSMRPESLLNMTCDESGWSPVHYAAVSGSSEVLELLLEQGCDVSIVTDVTHTWKESDGHGITPRELVQIVQVGSHEHVIETHGVALQEVTNTFFNHQQERRFFLNTLEGICLRLADIEKNGYSPPVSAERPDTTIGHDILIKDNATHPS
jgi:hypothetical protein